MIPHMLVVECEVPEGMTLREWRWSRAPARERPLLVRHVRRVCRMQRHR